jgi:hypothetical protein
LTLHYKFIHSARGWIISSSDSRSPSLTASPSSLIFLLDQGPGASGLRHESARGPSTGDTNHFAAEYEDTILASPSRGLVLLTPESDGIFNKNKLRLPLLTGVGITNSGKTLPCASSYYPGETAESYDFFFQILCEEMSVDSCEPTVIMGDQSAGLISAVDTLGSVPRSQLQFCNWHAVEAMRAKFTKSRYHRRA